MTFNNNNNQERQFIKIGKYSYVVLLALLLFLALGSNSALAANPLDEWAWRNPLPQGNSLNGVCYGNGIFAAVGLNGTILTSVDGVNWTVQVQTQEKELKAVAYGNGTFVAVGKTILTSSDGVNWEEANTSGTWYYSLSGIAYGNGTFVVLNSSTNGRTSFFTSKDGLNWILQSTVLQIGVREVTYANGTFVAVGAGTIATSSDGEEWTTQYTGKSVLDVTYGNGIFVVVGENGTVLTSFDALNWADQQLDPGTALLKVTYGNGMFVGIGNNKILTSPNGENWTTYEQNVNSWQYIKEITYGNGNFVAVGEWGIIMTSRDGLDWESVWTSSNPPENTSYNLISLQSIAYGNGTYIAIGNGGNIYNWLPLTYISPDGVNWSYKSLEWSDNLSLVSYVKGQFLMFGTGGDRYNPSTFIYTSTDGVNWTREIIEDSKSIHDVTYNNGIYVAVGSGGTIISSIDGENWIKSSVETSNALYGVTYGNGTFVAVGQYSTLLISPDGVNWEIKQQGNGYFDDYNDVTFGNGIFVLAQEEYLRISSDGIQWIAPEQHPFWDAYRYDHDFHDIQEITYANGIFAAVGIYGDIATSMDGEVWTVRKNGENDSNHFWGITFGKNTFMIVGDGTTILQSGLIPDMPVPSFTIRPINNENKGFTFDASDSYCKNGEIISYKWNFGDGTNRSGKEVSHVYSQIGKYEVSLTVTNNLGVSVTAREYIDVVEGLKWYLNSENKVVLNTVYVSDAYRYNFYRDGILIGETTGNSFVDEGALIGETYTYEASFTRQEDGQLVESKKTPPLRVTVIKLPKLHIEEAAPSMGRDSTVIFGDYAYRYYYLLDENNQPVPGFKVRLKGSSETSTTSKSGLFGIKFSSNDQIILSHDTVTYRNIDNETVQVSDASESYRSEFLLPAFRLAIEPKRYVTEYVLSPEIEAQVSVAKGVAANTLKMEFARDSLGNIKEVALERQKEFGAGINTGVGMEIEVLTVEAKAGVEGEAVIKAGEKEKYQFEDYVQDKYKFAALVVDSVRDMAEIIQVPTPMKNLSHLMKNLYDNFFNKVEEGAGVEATVSGEAGVGFKAFDGMGDFALDIKAVEGGVSLSAEAAYSEYLKDPDYQKVKSSKFTGTTTFNLLKAKLFGASFSSSEIDRFLRSYIPIYGNTKIWLEVKEYFPHPGKPSKVKVAIGHGSPGENLETTLIINKTAAIDPINQIIGSQELDNMDSVAQVFVNLLEFLSEHPYLFVDYEETNEKYSNLRVGLGGKVNLAGYSLELKGGATLKTNTPTITSTGKYMLDTHNIGLNKLPLTSAPIQFSAAAETQSSEDTLFNDILHPVTEELEQLLIQSLTDRGHFAVQPVEAGSYVDVSTVRAKVYGSMLEAKYVTIMAMEPDISEPSDEAGLLKDVLVPGSMHTVFFADQEGINELGQLASPVNLTIICNDEMLSAAGIAPEETGSIILYYYDSIQGSWEVLNTGTWDNSTNSLTASIIKGGTYALGLNQGPPSLEVIFPAPDQETPGNFTIQAQIYDLNGVDYFNSSVSLDGTVLVSLNDWLNYYDPATGEFTYSLSAVAAGDHVLAFDLKDYLGNEEIYDVPFQADAEPPILTLVNPAGGGVVYSNTVQIEGITEPGAEVTVQGIKVPVDLDGNFTVELPLLPGENTIDISTEDAAGNISSEARTVYVESIQASFNTNEVSMEKGQTETIALNVSGEVSGTLQLEGRYPVNLLDNLTIQPGNASAGEAVVEVNNVEGKFTISMPVAGQGDILSIGFTGINPGTGRIEINKMSVTEIDGNRTAIEAVAECQVDVNNIEGVAGIVHSGGVPLGDVVITTGALETITDNEGRYLFNNILPDSGTFDLKAVKKGYRQKTADNLLYLQGRLMEYNIDILEDSLPPSVLSTNPHNGGSLVSSGKITVEFNEEIEKGSAFDDITVTDADGSPILFSSTINNNILTITVNGDLDNGAAYTVIIPANGVDDLALNALADEYSFSFKINSFLDVNGDGELNLIDLAELASRYGTKVSEPGSSVYDLNNDGTIDLFDLVYLAQKLY